MKVLIYKYISDLKPVGGSCGYCFNIYQELLRRDIKSIEFVSSSKPENKKKSNSLSKYFSSFFGQLFSKETDDLDYNLYDVIHFHSTKELYRCRKKLKKYKGKVILTTHSPIPYHLEMMDNIRDHHKIIGHLLCKHFFSYIDKKAFSLADYIILPCKEAEESYYKHWKRYSKIHKRNDKKYIYIPTGIVEAKSKIDRETYRKQHGLSKDDFVVSYVGRHNEIKGYDRLIDVFNNTKDLNIKFLIGGKEFPLQGPKDSNWIEIGWTDDPYSLINCSDVFILPNRETYFDIILLEVLSLGKSCIISNTGGNKLILNQHQDGIYGFNDVNECLKALKALVKENHKDKLSNGIMSLFNDNYSIEIFVNKYIDTLKEILNEKD